MKENLLRIFCLVSPLAAFGQGIDVPKVYLPNIVSSGYNERDMAISPDGGEMFYTIQALRTGVSVIIRRTSADSWKSAEVAPFSGQYSDLEATFSPDGKKLFFASNRPTTPGVQ